MGLVITTTVGIIVWIVMWAIGIKSIDGFLITTMLIVLGAAGRILVPHLPGRAR